jgi:phosphoribosylformylglycinamidine synthase
VVLGQEGGPPPALDLTRERELHDFMLDAARAGLLRSAHDVAEGGLLVAVAETCLFGGIGIRASTYEADGNLRLDTQFFAESQGRFVVTSTSRAMPELQSLARRFKIELQLLGLTGGNRILFENQVDVPLAEVREAWLGGLERVPGEGGTS